MSTLKTTVTTLALSCVLASNAHAGFRLNDGRVLIKTGDPVAKIHQHIKPTKSYSGKVCAKPSVMSCRRKGSTHGRIYEYEIKKVTYVVQSNSGQITYIEWKY
ncbi:hypothetical protein CLV44_109105 [Marinobacterium halophilum]|uniref:DUF2845 domain-containing protein n=1 Tax=Marinobacterium halophilum TaxID=267374 RepID=A0A2P8EXH9_9GAMM|nr:hypothetical protein CLV44_109105 [Marinobacterium halophilum]